MKLNLGQQAMLDKLSGSRNVFASGPAGTGKSTVLSEFTKSVDKATCAILASTGSAASIVHGRTFHSFFALGKCDGPHDKIVAEALRNKNLVERLNRTEILVIDEVSMLPGKCINAAEEIARKAYGSRSPWGGLKVNMFGDFAQLPPVSKANKDSPDWAFNAVSWKASDFAPSILSQVCRTDNAEFIEILNEIRRGHISDKGKTFLNYCKKMTVPADCPRCFAKNSDADSWNVERLRSLPGPETVIETEYSGDSINLAAAKKLIFHTDKLRLKIGAPVIIRINDPDGRYFNGTHAKIEEISETFLTVRLANESKVQLEKFNFEVRDGDNKIVAIANNFPVILGWAFTIHKSQGMSLDSAYVDLSNLWDCGQAYVALSRVKSPDRLFIKDWQKGSIIASKEVTSFYNNLEAAI